MVEAEVKEGDCGLLRFFLILSWMLFLLFFKLLKSTKSIPIARPVALETSVSIQKYSKPPSDVGFAHTEACGRHLGCKYSDVSRSSTGCVR
jgi:hypothetical protein